MSTDKCQDCELLEISITTMKTRILELESEISRLRADANKPHAASPGWSGDDSGEYHQGFRGHGY